MNADEEDLMREVGRGEGGLLFANGVDRSKLFGCGYDATGRRK